MILANSSKHLHPAIVHLLLAGFSFGCFAVVAENVASHKSITTFDAHQASRIYEYSSSHLGVWNIAAGITDLGAGRPRFIVICVVAIFLIAHRQCRLALFWAATQWLVKDIVGIAKDWFERPRPQFDGNFVVGGWSFPSGHSMGAMATYCMIAFLVALRWPDKRFCWPVIGLLGLIILAVGMSRMLLGVHYFTDVLGGFLLGLAYISLCIAAIKSVPISRR